MEDGRYRHLPVVEDGKVVGIVSRFDCSGLELSPGRGDRAPGADLTGEAEQTSVKARRAP